MFKFIIGLLIGGYLIQLNPTILADTSIVICEMIGQSEVRGTTAPDD